MGDRYSPTNPETLPMDALVDFLLFACYVTLACHHLGHHFGWF
jgi:hypothetical protein